MNTTFTKIRWFAAGVALLTVSLLLFGAMSKAKTQEVDEADPDLAKQILETLLQVPGNKAGYRTVHAKGIVCQGTFTPSRDAAPLSKAAHFQGASTQVIVRFSDGAADPFVPDNSPNAGPR